MISERKMAIPDDPGRRGVVGVAPPTRGRTARELAVLDGAKTLAQTCGRAPAENGFERPHPRAPPMTIVPWQGRNPSHQARLLAWLLLLLPIAVILLYPLANDYLQAASLLRRISDPKATGWLDNYEVH